MSPSTAATAGRVMLRLVACCVFLVADCNAAEAPKFDYNAMLGVAVAKANRTCLDIRNAALSPGQRIQLVITSTPQAIGEAEITRRVDEACTAADQNKPGLYHYEFKLVRGDLEKAVPVIAIASSNAALTAGKFGVIADIEGDGRTESFRSCTSREGVHLTAWSGKPLQGRRRWHYYYYLGYDVDPDCSRRDTQPDAK